MVTKKYKSIVIPILQNQVHSANFGEQEFLICNGQFITVPVLKHFSYQGGFA